MDGLSNPVTVIKLIQSTLKLASDCYKYFNDVKNADSDIKRLCEEIHGQVAILKHAQDLIEGPDGGQLRTSQALRSAVNKSRSELDRIQRQLEENGPEGCCGGLMSRIWKRARWPFQKEDVESIVKNLQEIKGDMEFVLTIDQNKGIIKIHSEMAFSNLPVAKGAAFDAHANEHEHSCHPETRVELLSGIYTWSRSQDGRCIYWLRGLAGTGKSTISRTVAQRLAEEKIPAASFFFKKGEGDRGRSDMLFSTIANQLVWRLPAMKPHVQQAMENNESITDKALKHQFEELILNPLKSCKPEELGSRFAVVVLDALDECDNQKDAATIVKLLSKAKELTSIRLMFFITSRPELPIRLGFEDITGDYEDVALHEVPKPDIEHDISLFLRFRLGQIRDDFNRTVPRSSRLRKDWPPSTLVDKLVEMSVPLFIFAATACRFINHSALGTPDEQACRFLQYRDSGKANHLAMTYRPVLDQLLVERVGSECQDLPKDERDSIIDRFLQVVGTIVLLADPLSTASLAQLLNVSQATIDSHLSVLHSVLDIRKDPNSPVKPFHLSFRDFLVDPGDRDNNPFWVDEPATHGNLARRCLELLSRDDNLKEDICGLEHPGKLRTDIERSTINACLPPHIQYACLYWVFHLKESNGRIRDDDGIYLFLTAHLIHWLETLSLLGRITESLGMVDDLLGMVDSENGNEASSLLRDTKRFILMYRSLMDTAPLQIYSSALVFAPKESIFRKRFERSVPHWIRHPPTVPTHWSSCLQTLEGHTHSVDLAVFSPDSSLIASATYREIRIWRTDTGNCTQKLNRDILLYVRAVAFSLDSALLHSVWSNGEVVTWETDTWECKTSVKPPLERDDDDVMAAAFSADLKLVALAFPRKMEIWPMTMQGNCLTRIDLKTRDVSSVVFSPDSTMLYSGGQVWQVESGQLMHEFSRGAAAFSPDSSLVALALDEMIEIRRLDACGSDSVRGRFVCEDSANKITFSHDSALLAAGLFSLRIKIWFVETGDCIQTLDGHADYIFSLSFSHDSTLLASASWDETLRIWNVGKDESVESPAKLEEIDSIALSPDSSLVLLRGRERWGVLRADSNVRVRELATSDLAGNPTFTPDSSLATMMRDGTAEIWHPDRGSQAQKLLPLEWPKDAFAFSADFTLVAIFKRDDGSLRIWRMGTGACMQVIESGVPEPRDEEGEVSEEDAEVFAALLFSLDASHIALHVEDAILVWEADTGAPVHKFDMPTEVTVGVFTLTNTKLAARCKYRIRIWSLRTGDMLRDLQLGGEFELRRMAFSCDSTLLASASVWNIEIRNADTGACMHTINTTGEITHLSFEPDNLGLHTNAGDIGFRDSTASAWYRRVTRDDC